MSDLPKGVDLEALARAAREVRQERDQRRAPKVAALVQPSPASASPLVKSDNSKRSSLKFVRAAEVVPKPVDWVWPSRLARGKLTIFTGDPGNGKSQISTDIAAKITTGETWPDGEDAITGSVLILSAEDAAHDTIVPRLMAAKADLSRVHILTSVIGPEGRLRSFDLQQDLSALGEKIKAVGDVVLVIIDPITSYMGNLNSHRTTDVRAVLEPVAEWAGRYNVALLAISHPPKASQSKAINAVTGSLAFAAAARLVFLAIADLETERLVLLPVKNNVGPMAAGLGYEIVADKIAPGVTTSRIRWDATPVTVTANQALRADGSGNRNAIKTAESFLREFLREGGRSAEEVETAAIAEGISARTLARAKAKLNITSRKKGFEKGWTWELN